MNRNQKGFSSLIVIGLLLTISLAGFGIVRIINKDKSELRQADSNQQTAQESLEEGNAREQNELKASEIIELAEDERITIVSQQDLDKLPAKTPETFKAYMTSAIDTNQNDPQCDIAYVITKISSVNIRGAIGPVDKGSTTGSTDCGGGAAMIWYLDSEGNWKSLGFQDSPSCEDVKKFKIYSEFLEECYDLTTDETVPNPVGSITQINQ